MYIPRLIQSYTKFPAFYCMFILFYNQMCVFSVLATSIIHFEIKTEI